MFENLSSFAFCCLHLHFYPKYICVLELIPQPLKGQYEIGNTKLLSYRPFRSRVNFYKRQRDGITQSSNLVLSSGGAKFHQYVPKLTYWHENYISLTNCTSIQPLEVERNKIAYQHLTQKPGKYKLVRIAFYAAYLPYHVQFHYLKTFYFLPAHR